MNWKEVLKLLVEYAEFVHWGKLIGFTLLGVFLGLLLGILTVTFTRKYIFVQRDNKYWKMIAYVWLIGIPLWFAYTGLKYGVIHAAEKNVLAEIPAIIGTAGAPYGKSISDDWLDALLTDGGYQCKECEGQIFLEFTPNNAIDIGVAFFYDYYVGALDKITNNKVGFVAKTAEVLKGFVTVKFVSYMLKKTLKDQLESKLQLPANVTDELLATSFRDYLDEGFLKKFTTLIIEDLFKSLKKGTLTMFFIVIAIPGIEIAIAHYFHRKNQEEILL